MPSLNDFDDFISLVLKKVDKNTMFKRMNNSITGSKTITLTVEGKEIAAFQGDTVAAAMLVAGFAYTQITPVKRKATCTLLHDGNMF